MYDLRLREIKHSRTLRLTGLTSEIHHFSAIFHYLTFIFDSIKKFFLKHITLVFNLLFFLL
jgi:hypothetical protein